MWEWIKERWAENRTLSILCMFAIVWHLVSHAPWFVEFPIKAIAAFYAANRIDNY